MRPGWRDVIEPQFAAALEMLENAMRACPEALWSDRSRTPEFWYVAYHTLFWLDLYLFGSFEDFAPPPPFGLEEMDPAGVMPPRAYNRDELLSYLEHDRGRLRAAMLALTDERASAHCGIERFPFNGAELHLYTLRHVQHHAAQLNLLLRQATDSAPRWVRRGTLA